jgi:protein-S-isoprenylcysteine O-methyltransferase Ste14
VGIIENTAGGSCMKEREPLSTRKAHAKRKTPNKRRIIKTAIKEDLLKFAAPGFIVFYAGLRVSAEVGVEPPGWIRFPRAMWDLIRDPGTISTLSFWNILGLIMIVVGFAILLTAPITLGRNHAAVPMIWEDQQLIRHGIYRLVRHSLYLGVIIFSIGPGIYGPSFPGVLLMSLLIPIFLIRIRIEEKLLLETFGDAYREYQKTTRTLIPFVY